MTKLLIAIITFVIFLTIITFGSVSGTGVMNEASMLFAAPEGEESLFDEVYYPAIIEFYKEEKILVPLSYLWAIGFYENLEDLTIDNVKKTALDYCVTCRYYRIATDVDDEGNEYEWEEEVPEDEMNCDSRDSCKSKWMEKCNLNSKEEFGNKVIELKGGLPENFKELVLSFEPLDTVFFGDILGENGDIMEDVGDIDWDQEILLPFSNYTITCEFGCYPGHNAIDLQPVPRIIATNHPMQAGCSGTISQNAYDSMGGNYVTIQCSESNLQLYYGHMISRSTHALGSVISKGDIIGYVGSTGFVTGPHVHWKFLINGKAVNPRLIYTFK